MGADGAIARAVRAIGRAITDERAPPFDPDCLERRDVALIDEVLPAFEWIAREWLSLEVEGAEHLRTAPALLVGNHNGGIMGPDLFCTMSALWRTLGTETPLYAMAHDLAMRHVRPLGRLVQRAGGIRAHPDNALRVLRGGGRVLVYPGGELDAYRHFRMRDRVVFGSRTGFVRVAQAAGAPIVPIVAYGAHRSAIILHEGEWLAGALGLTRWGRIRRFPIALALPWGIGAGPWVPYLPLPLPIRLRVLAPIEVAPGDEPAAVRDEVVARMQRAMDEMAARDRRKR
ncbi:MAG: 1-acyl-sn-glycerol-3-phosphate acyltransferase [Myxococcota bacterium]|nr:1-acyl-sn-glycerol-3-phosphate acyltransferase [Myxococcota bacterium]